MCTKGPSLPRHMPDDTANMAPIPLTAMTLKSRKCGITKPDRIVLISGMPEPAAIYIDLPTPPSPVPGEAAGRDRFVNIVKDELMIPKASANPMNIASGSP